MATQRQIESARINGAKSRGPNTLEGKRRSSANARKHGLTSKTIAPDPAALEALNAAIALYVAKFHPASPAELFLIHQMAAAKIRQHQACAAETEAWNRALAAHNGCIAQAFQALANSNELACILRYQTRFSRQYHRAFEQLLASRKSRLPNKPDRSPLRNTILPNEPEPEPALANALKTILQNEPEMLASDPPSRTGSAKGTGSTRVPRRCAHRCFFQTTSSLPPPPGDIIVSCNVEPF